MTPTEFADLAKWILLFYVIGAAITFVGGSIYIYRQRNNFWNTFDGIGLFLLTFGWVVILPYLLVEKWAEFLNRMD